jgi:hypothetical protein
MIGGWEAFCRVGVDGLGGVRALLPTGGGTPLCRRTLHLVRPSGTHGRYGPQLKLTSQPPYTAISTPTSADGASPPRCERLGKDESARYIRRRLLRPGHGDASKLPIRLFWTLKLNTDSSPLSIPRASASQVLPRRRARPVANLLFELGRPRSPSRAPDRDSGATYCYSIQ